jgi:hypothetical protein
MTTKTYILRYGKTLLLQEVKTKTLPIDLAGLCQSYDGIVLRKIYGRGHFAEIETSPDCFESVKPLIESKGCEIFEAENQYVQSSHST